MFWRKNRYSLSKARYFLKERIEWYKKREGSLEPRQASRFKRLLCELDEATLKKDRVKTAELIFELKSFGEAKRSIFSSAIEFVVAVSIALAVATCIRATLFEPFKIPTGSMRPTFAELDHLVVSKTAFGINLPLQNRHLYFDPSLVKRGEVVIWSGFNVDLPETDTNYFFLFPGKKRYIKRVMGLPGDTLYFYGGRIYGVDREGSDIYCIDSGREKLDYIPFHTFEGRVALEGKPSSAQVVLKQFNRPVGRFSLSTYGSANAMVYNGQEWIKEDPLAALQPHDKVQTYSDFIGMRNFAMARLLTKEELSYSRADVEIKRDALLYLELRHTPNLTDPKPRVGELYGQLRVALTPYTTVLPLDSDDLKVLMKNMYTSRFVVKEGYIAPWQIDGAQMTSSAPRAPNIPDGVYEFSYGKAYKIGLGGVATELSADHPLYSSSAENVQLFYNLGLEFNTAFSPYSIDQLAFPARYVYFREGDLYTMGAVLLEKGSTKLEKFIESERGRQNSSTQDYVAFKDHGAPLKEGRVDAAFIRAFGLTVPDHCYVVLGDNHARSADSRTFGFLPEQNLEGTPLAILWPYGSRWGLPSQNAGEWFGRASVIMWSIAAFSAAVWFYRRRKIMREPLTKDLASSQQD